MSEPKKISTTPILFGLESRFVSNQTFYFDDDYFYAVSEKGAVKIFKLSDLTELSRTGIIITNRSIWKVKFLSRNNEEIIYQFAHNYTLWNRSFAEFYAKIKKLKPEAVKSTWSWWRI